jgi:hypothetical protein
MDVETGDWQQPNRMRLVARALLAMDCGQDKYFEP